MKNKKPENKYYFIEVTNRDKSVLVAGGYETEEVAERMAHHHIKAVPYGCLGKIPERVIIYSKDNVEIEEVMNIKVKYEDENGD